MFESKLLSQPYFEHSPLPKETSKSIETSFERMSTQGEQSGAVVGQEEGLSEEQKAMIQAFVGMVRRGEIPMDQGGLGATNEGAIDSTKAKDPNEADGEEYGGNGSLRVELQHKTRVYSQP